LDATGWGSGYATDHAYTTKFYLEQGPDHLNTACVLSGFEPLPLDRPFTYLELGCGQGVTVTLLAAANPHGRFYGNDFMPAHVAAAEQLITAARLDNLTMLENSFEELARGQVDLPRFDFITLHGVYTWVSRENRRHIVDIIARYLKPGGIVYVTYNALPGWAPAQPLQRLLLSQSALHAGDSGRRVLRARDFVEDLIGAQAQYFARNPGLGTALENLRGGDPAYLVHEHLHSGWEPVYHADVAGDLQAAKLDHVGSATLSTSSQTFPEAQQRLLDSVRDPAWRETVKDFLLNTSFRKDVFVRGRRPMPAHRQAEWLRPQRLALIVPRKQASFGFEWGATPGDDGDSPAAVLDALAARPHRLDELAQRPLFGGSFELVTGVAKLMTDARVATWVGPARDGVDPAPALRLNRAVAAQSRYTGDALGLVSPLTGNGIRASRLECLVYGELAERPQVLDPQAIAARVASCLHDPQPGATPDLAALAGEVAHVVAHSLPMWRGLSMI